MLDDLVTEQNSALNRCACPIFLEKGCMKVLEIFCILLEKYSEI